MLDSADGVPSARQDVSDFVGRLWVALSALSSRLGSHRAGGRVDVRDITEKFEFTTEAALVPFNMQELRCCRTWKVYVTEHDARRTVDVHTESERDESHVRYESGWSDRSYVSKANTVVDGIKKVIGVDVIVVEHHYSNIYARPRRYHRVNDGRKRNSH
jgi:hypothetical protein